MQRYCLLMVLTLGFGTVWSLAGEKAASIPLVKGDNPDLFDLIGIGPEAIQIKDGVVTVSGKPNGYFATKTVYKNYTLSFEWRYPAPEGYKAGDPFNGNSGLLIHIPPDSHKVWPKCTEAQLAYGEAGHTFAINGAKFNGTTDREGLKKSRKPVGEWNQQVVTCKDGQITCTLNGIEVAKGSGADPAEGVIGWQSEGAKIDFRKIELTPIE